MPRVAEEKRVRKKRPKLRSGCKTCKARRVRCDENRPLCTNCTSRGRQCLGYDAPPALTAGTVSDAVISDFAFLGCGHFESEQDCRAFAFFQHQTTSELAGFDTCEFWTIVILQASEVDDGVRHAVLALAALHETFKNTGSAQIVKNRQASAHYSLAIKSHVTSLSKEPQSCSKLSMYLASAVLFFCIEALQAHYASSMSLVGNAVKLLKELQNSRLRGLPWSLETLEAVFCRLQAQIIALAGHTALPETVAPHIQAGILSRIPTKFATIKEANRYFEFCRTSNDLSNTSSGTTGLCPETPQITGDFKTAIVKWSAAFNAMQRARGLVASEKDRQSLIMLTVRQRFFILALSIATRYPNGTWDPAIFDQFTEIYRELVDLAEQIVVAPSVSNASQPRKTFLPGRYTFTLDFGIVAPLYDVAHKCRDPSIRRKAIQLLRLQPRREGLLDSALAARVLQHIMEIEERAVARPVLEASDIPSTARISSIIPIFDPDQQRVFVRYYKECFACTIRDVPFWQETLAF